MTTYAFVPFGEKLPYRDAECQERRSRPARKPPHLDAMNDPAGCSPAKK